MFLLPPTRRISVFFGLVIAGLALLSVLSPAQQTESATKRALTLKIAPVYPALARRCNLQGIVRLSVVVAADGKVRSVSLLGGNPVLGDAAVNAVRQWKFSPAPNETTELVELHFAPH